MNNDYDGNISSGGFIGLLSLYLYHTIIEPALHLLLVISVFCQLIIIIYLGSLIYLMEDTSMINRISDAIEKQDAFSTCIFVVAFDSDVLLVVSLNSLEGNHSLIPTIIQIIA